MSVKKDEIVDSDDERPATLLHAYERGSISSIIDNSVNKPMPWIVIVAIIGSLALGFSIAAFVMRSDDKSDTRAQLTTMEGRLTKEQRDMGVECTLLRNHVDELKTKLDVLLMTKGPDVCKKVTYE